jgi:hypothetical protein
MKAGGNTEEVVMSPAERKVVAFLRSKRDRLCKELERRGGRGVSLAEHIDRLDAATDALEGTLAGPHGES